MTRRAHGMALLRSGVLVTLALAGGPVPTTAAPQCTFTFPPEGGVYEQTVVAGDVLCGGPGPDRVRRMHGGVFLGRGGSDHVRAMTGGDFAGGRGNDKIDMAVRGGSVVGGRGRDLVYYLRSGVFHGGVGNDRVDHLDYPGHGTFHGGPGTDRVTWFRGGTFRGGDDADIVLLLFEGVFRGGAGDDLVDCYSKPGTTVLGGPGDDHVESLYGFFDGGPGRDTYSGEGTVISADRSEPRDHTCGVGDDADA